jgi:hypothetical protein
VSNKVLLAGGAILTELVETQRRCGGFTSAARAALVLAGAGLLLAGTSTAAHGWKTYRSAGDGFSIAVPELWQVIPATRESRLGLVARLRARGERDRARLVGSYGGRDHPDVRGRVFWAVQYPELPGALTTDVTVSWTRLPRTSRNPRGLLELSSFLADRLERSTGFDLATRRPRPVTLAAGRAYLVYGTSRTPGPGGARTAFATYLLLGHGGLFNVTLRTDSRYFEVLKPTFGSIAGTFAAD